MGNLSPAVSSLILGEDLWQLLALAFILGRWPLNVSSLCVLLCSWWSEETQEGSAPSFPEMELRRQSLGGSEVTAPGWIAAAAGWEGRLGSGKCLSRLLEVCCFLPCELLDAS